MTGRLLLGIGAIALMTGVLLIWQTGGHSSTRHWFDIIPIGEPFPSLQVSDTDGNEIDLNDILIGKWSLVVFTGAPTPADMVYPQLLVDHFGDTDFQFLAVVPKNWVPRERPNDSPLLIDANQAFQERLGIPDELLGRASWTVLLRPDRKVEFSFPLLLKNQELRRLIEDRLGKPAESIDDEAGEVRVGTRLERLQLKRLASDERIDLDRNFGRSVTLVYFTANACSVCSSTTSGDQMRRLAERLATGDNKHNLFIVFSHFVLPEAIPNTLEVREHIYQMSRESSMRIENPYFSLGGEEDAPFVLEISQDWVVTEKASLDDWLRSSQTKPKHRMGAALR